MRTLLRLGSMSILLLVARSMWPADPSGASAEVAPIDPLRVMLLGMLIAVAIIQGWAILRGLSALLLDQTRVEEESALLIPFAAYSAAPASSLDLVDVWVGDLLPRANSDPLSVEAHAVARSYIWIDEPAYESVEEI